MWIDRLQLGLFIAHAVATRKASQKHARSAVCQSVRSKIQTLEGSLVASKDMKFGVVVGRFNDLVTKLLLEGALEAFERHGASLDNVEVRTIPEPRLCSITIRDSIRHVVANSRASGSHALHMFGQQRQRDAPPCLLWHACNPSLALWHACNPALALWHACNPAPCFAPCWLAGACIASPCRDLAS
jgi:hypothetical protein